MTTNNNLIREFLNLSTVDRKFVIEKVDGLGYYNENTLMFINKHNINLGDYDELNANCVFLIDESYPEFDSRRNEFIRVNNPKYKFCKVVEKFKLPSKFQMKELKGYIEGIQIGNNTHIDPGVILGGTDFSPVLTDDNKLVQFPQMGGVVIGSDVVIKYNTMVGKGTFGCTSIGDNTMIDFGCQIGHNCQVGKSCIIAAGTIIGGSTTIGDHVTIGIGAKIRNGLKIGDNVSIGMGSVVIRDIPANCVVVGNPARVIEHKPIFDEGGLV